MFTLQVNETTMLRVLSARDAARLYEITNQSRSYLREWLPWLDSMTSVDDSLQFIKNALETFNNRTGVTFGIFYEQTLVGVIGFNKLDFRNKFGSIGYWIDEEYQGKGIMTESVSMLVSHGFRTLGLNRVDIRAAVNNWPSRNIPERLGFQLEGVLRQMEWLYNHYVDHAVYGMLASEWDCTKHIKISTASTKK